MYYTEYDDERPRWWKPVAAAVVVAMVVAIAYWQLNSDSDSGSGTGASEATTTAPAAPAPTSATSTPASTPSEEVDGTATSVDEDAATSTEPRRDTSASTTVAGNRAPATTTGSTSSGSASTTAVASAPPAPAQSPLGYPTSPDGTPLPIVVIFDTDTITIAGQVPSQAAKDRLAGLAVANSKFPDAELVDDTVINPAVPISIGTRVIELNSARFPEGSAEILPEHALELDRVANIMTALPSISVLVIGHADQRGDDQTNFAISDERARAVVNYLLYLGISPTRLASRAAGETDLLTLADDDTALALNRRTEFIFYGLLIE